MEAVFGADASPIFREKLLPRCMRSDSYIQSPGLPEGDDPVAIKAREQDYTEWRQERRDFLLKKARMVSVYLTGTLSQSSLDRVKDTRENDMDKAVKESDILSVHQIVWDSHQYRGKTFKVADQQRVQREFTMFNFVSGESLPSLRRRLSELLEKMKNYDVYPEEFQIMYTFLMAAARYPNSHVQDICVDYLKSVDDPTNFPTDLSEVYELMISTQDVVNQVANRGSIKQNHEGSVHQTAVRQTIRSLQAKREKGKSKKAFPIRKPVAQVNSAYSNINKSVRKKLETHTLSGRPKNKFADEAVDRLVANNPGMSRSDGYKVQRCTICGKIGHLDKDHRGSAPSRDGYSNKPRGPKKSFRSKRGKKGRVNNTNGRTVTFDDDGDAGWIGSVFAVTGRQVSCGYCTSTEYLEPIDSSSEESSDSSKSDKSLVNSNRSLLNTTSNYLDEVDQRVFSSEESFNAYLVTLNTISILKDLRRSYKDLQDSDFSYERLIK